MGVTACPTREAKPKNATQNNNISGNDVKYCWKRLTSLAALAIAIPYFLLDAIFATVAIPLSRWIAGHWAFARIHRWILSLRPYPNLLLFLVPVIVLEPAKPLAAYLVATHHTVLGLSTLAVAEMLKLVFIERLFSISRDKLMSIPAFAWAYGKYSAMKDCLMSTEAWQAVLRWTRIARSAAKRWMLEARRSMARGETREERSRWIPARATAARQGRE
jgi:hypothetical protein